MAQARRRRRRIRRSLACLLAPAAVAPLIVLIRISVLEMPWHWHEYWWEELAYFTLLSYFGSTLAAPLVMLAMRIGRREASVRAVWGWFTLICCTLAAAISTMYGWHSAAHRLPGSPPPGPLLGLTLIGFIVALVGSAPVGLAYGLIAGLPWRARPAVDRAEAADLPA